jgi:hypothetical protein
MAFETSVYMVASAPSLSHAALVILHAVNPLGVKMTTDFLESAAEMRKADPLVAGWEQKVDGWSDVLFGLLKWGPQISVKLTKLSPTTVRVRLEISGRSLNFHYLEGRRHEEIFYAPLFQIALGLGVRAGVGDLDLDTFKPTSEKEIEEAIWHSPQEPKYPSRLGFLRRTPDAPKPKGDFVVTERPEGFWLLEHPAFLRFLAS